ncbi:MAG: M28 family peptidase [Bacteroidota bacterium]
MAKKIISILVLIALHQFSFAQAEFTTSKGTIVKQDRAVPFAESITAEDMRAILTVLASDEYEGRETGTEGQRKAADYIADKFKTFGLPRIGAKNSYFQEMIYTGESWSQIKMKVGEEAYRHLWDFYSFPTRNSDRPTTKIEEVLFLGYGIDDPKYSDYEGKEVDGKTILIYAGEPKDKEGNYFISGSEKASSWSSNWRKKLETAKEKGVALVLIIDPNIQKNIKENRRFLLSSSMRIGAGEQPEDNFANNIYISSTVAKEIVGGKFKKVVKARDRIAKKGKLKSVNIPTDIEVVQDKKIRQLIGSNVLGYIEGSDPRMKDEVIVVTAHYDHLGKRGQSIYNGADDNGSGTATVLEVAEALVKAQKAGAGPRRSVLVMLVSGEEKGLLGSQYYAENPIFPLENTVANINVDMVGRVDKKYAKNPNYIYVIGSDRLSTELHEINETANKTYTNLVLDYTYNDDNDPNRYYYRSDHYNFAKKGIPAIFYFNGTHEDYHRSTDTVEKINFEKMEKIGKLVFYTTWELANRDKRIVVDVEGRN